MRRQAGFFDVDGRLKRLSDLGDQLEAFEAAVEFEAFRPELNAALTYSDGTQGGRPPFDPVMMFKILVIQTTNNLSDERAEFLINDRLSFMRFLGFGLSDRVPDARTIWLFREKLTKAGAIGPLSVIHGSYLDPRVKVMDGPGLPVRVSRRLRALTLYPMGAILWARRRQLYYFATGRKYSRLRPSLQKRTSCFPAPPPRCGPMKLAAVMIVTGCRCNLVWHCGRKGNGDGKANHGNDKRGYYNSG
jgi:hypothetical protein